MSSYLNVVIFRFDEILTIFPSEIKSKIKLYLIKLEKKHSLRVKAEINESLTTTVPLGLLFHFRNWKSFKIIWQITKYPKRFFVQIKLTSMGILYNSTQQYDEFMIQVAKIFKWV